MERLRYLAVASAALLWAGGATVAGGMFERGADATEMTAARAWIAATGIGLFLMVRRRDRPRPDRPPRAIAIIGFGLSLTAANLTYYVAISRLPVAVAIVIQYTAPGMVVMWTAFMERRAPRAPVLWALGLAFAGVALLSELPTTLAGGELALDGVGVASALGSALSFALYILIGERVGPAYGPVRATARGFAVASVAWIIVISARGRPDTLLDADFTLGLLFVGVGATIVPFLLFIWGLEKVGASRASIISMLEPPAAALFALIWLGQTLGAVQLVGAAMVIVGIGIVQSRRPRSTEALVESAAIE